MMEDDDIIREFLIESNENLNRLDVEIVDLERHPTAERLASIFRTIHTIKGTCGFLGFPILERITHHAEHILSQLRSGQREVTGGVVSIILESVDAVRKILTNVEAKSVEGEDVFAELTNRLSAFASHTSHVTEMSDATVDVTPVTSPSLSAAQSLPPVPAQVPVASSTATHVATPSASVVDTEKGASVVDTSIRVDVSLLDKLMNLVGELVLARNQILQVNNQKEDLLLNATSQRLNLITTELQESVMKTRMQPIGVIWNKLPRVVRDVAHLLGKQIELEMEGAETELDRTIIEAIKDPLTHIVRNSCDHGVEGAATRISAGKTPVGKLRLKAYHAGGQVNIEISDDGAGVDVERVKRRAVEKGLIREEHAAQMTEREAIGLLFMPGFSTATQITNVSGRGVGMDVVKSNVEKIGGSVDIITRFGNGSTVKLKIPLTLAIIPGLVITSAGHQFIVPQISLLEVIRLEGDARNKIEYVHDTPVYRRRGALLPIVALNDLLRLPGQPLEALNIVVLQAEDRPFGLIVDSVNDTQEIVVKPLGKQLKQLSCYSGSTVMGDGTIALILDVLGLGQLSGVLSRSRDEAKAGSQQSLLAVSETQRLLLFKSGSFERLAVPLSIVARLEEIPRSSIEFASGKQVIQYRNSILPLISLSDVLEPGLSSSRQDEDPIQVVVFGNEKRTIGMIVDKIIDIVEDTVTNRRTASLRKGLLGSAVVSRNVVDFLDVQNVVETTEEGFFHAGTSSQTATLLLADSSPFSRGLLKGQLEMAGYRVLEASSIPEVLRHFQRSAIQVVVASGTFLSSDITSLDEMRKASVSARVPVLALSNTASEMALWKNHFSAFDDHQIRFERENMLRSIERLSKSMAHSKLSAQLDVLAEA